MISSKLIPLLAAGLLLTVVGISTRAHAAPETRVFELRTYHCAPGKLPDLEKRFREHTMQIFERHGMRNIGYWTFQDDPLKGNALIYMIAHASREQAVKNWKEFGADPEWVKVRTESEANGKIVEKVDSQFLDPTDFSPVK
jgi:hypothetical protein